jgi:hypothetical protein
MTIFIYDFDLTLSRLKHTFSYAGLRHQSQLDTHSQDQLEFGWTDSETNIKEGVCQKFNDEEHQVYVIATHHNNAAFIAGYMSRILGKTVSFEGHEFDFDQDIALAEYKVKGVGPEKSLFISYIPKVGDAFNYTRRKKLHGKNEQLIMLQEKLIDSELMQPGELINFYDDQVKNIIATENISNMNIAAHHIDGKNAQFTRIEPLKASNVSLIEPEITVNDALISKEEALSIMAQCGFVYPKTLSRQEAQERANQTGMAIMRESTSEPGLLALSLPNQARPLELNSLISQHPEHFRTAEMGIQYMESVFKCSIDRSRLDQQEECSAFRP